jgi:polyphenol oxidase
MIEFETLQHDGIRHGFFTRAGGVSQGIFASLNCGLGSGDDAAHVAENRRRALAALDLAPDRLATCHQIHSATVVVVDKSWRQEDRPRADAMVTTLPQVALGILTADCAPVLFADPEARVIGAAHAGWRGALGGVVEATVAAMQTLGADAKRIRAAVGPAIAQASYEVGPEFPTPFIAADPDAGRFFVAADRPGHFRFDLPAYVAARLRRLGLAAIAVSRDDTAADAARFFSYRRSCQRREPDYGRALSAIAMTSLCRTAS